MALKEATCCQKVTRCFKWIRSCLAFVVGCCGWNSNQCLDFDCPCIGTSQTDEKLFLKVSARLINHGQQDAVITLSQKDNAVYMRSFLCHTSTLVRYTYNLLAWVMLGMACFEHPAVVDVFPLWALWSVELICAFYFLVYTYRNRSFVDLSNQCDYRNAVTIVACCACLADCFTAMGLYFTGQGMPMRYSRPLRPIFIANSPFAYQLRKAITCAVKTVRDIMFALIMVLGSVILYAVIGYKVFSTKHLHYPDGLPWFPNFNSVLWELYVLLTTANSPDVMLPVFNVNPSTSIYFVSFLLVNTYIFMGFVLAVVVDTYKKHMKQDVINYVMEKRRALDLAFHMVCEKREDGDLFVTQDKFNKLIHYIKPDYGALEREVMFHMLDPINGEVGKEKFLSLSELLTVRIAFGIGAPNCIGKQFPDMYFSKYSMIFINLASSSALSYAIDTFIILNVILYIANCTQVEMIFLVVFTFEICIKLYGMNFEAFWSDSWNKFDILVVLGAWTIEFLDFAGKHDPLRKFHMADVILVLRILRITKVMRKIPGFRTIVSTIQNIIPSLVSFGNILVLIYYLYAMIGMELFGGRIVEDGSSNCGNPRLNLTEFAIKGYCSMNFNNIAHSYLTLFTLMVVNQWHVLTDGYVKVTNDIFRLYFISFHMIAVIIILNIVNAFILELFMLNYEDHDSDVITAVEAKISEFGLGPDQKPDRVALEKVLGTKDFEYLLTKPDYLVCDKQASKTVWVCLEQLFGDSLKQLGIRRDYSMFKIKKKAENSEEKEMEKNHTRTNNSNKRFDTLKISLS